MKRFFLTFLGSLVSLISVGQTFNGQLGYGVSPLGHSADFSQFGAFLNEVGLMCNGNGVVLVNANWRDNINTSGSIPTVHKTVSQLQPSPYGYHDMLAFPFAEYPTLFLNTNSDTTNNWTNSNMKSLFLQMLRNTADSLHPEYIFIGNEINFYWAQDSVDFLNFVGFYHQAYDTIKLYSPNTKVGTIFNYEHLSGNGVNVGWNTPYWNALNVFNFNKIDVFGMTVYPFFNYNQASLVPSNYMSDFFQQIGNKQVYFTETGWPADSFIGTWTCSPQQQEIYIDSLVNFVSQGNVIGLNWLYLHYLMDPQINDGIKIFNSVSLRDSLGLDRPALLKWTNLCSTTSVLDNESERMNYKIFPNPSSNSAIITSPSRFKYCLLNNIGETLLVSDSYNTEFDIYTNNLLQGIYFVKCLTENNHIHTLKLVKSN
ncbi:MAG: glycosyl hydrolase 53 family protein [Flavobacteriales bacterium]|nr:glycosyl hydrolase 53 family protein [Flavobacteriales bacterium]